MESSNCYDLMINSSVCASGSLTSPGLYNWFVVTDVLLSGRLITLTYLSHQECFGGISLLVSLLCRCTCAHWCFLFEEGFLPLELGIVSTSDRCCDNYLLMVWSTEGKNQGCHFLEWCHSEVLIAWLDKGWWIPCNTWRQTESKTSKFHLSCIGIPQNLQ